jgi:tRNA(fMet)-specific endonuclease VapC
MARALVDTDILSEILKGKNPRLLAKADAYRATYGVITTSVITVMEVIKGLHKLGDYERQTEFLTAIASEEVLSLDLESAEIAGRIYADLEREGKTVGWADAMIAGIAIRHQLPLVSGNTAHYTRISDLGLPLVLENWRD